MEYKGKSGKNGRGSVAIAGETAIDGQRNAGGVDKFRVKIWDRPSREIVYDNQVSGDTDDNASPNTALGGGSVVIHKP